MAIPKFANRAWEKTTTTGTGSSIALSGAVDNAHFTFAEAGVQDGDVVSYLIIDGTNVELQRRQTYTASGATLSRAATPHMSKIGGTAGTSQINLSGNATVVLVPFGEDFDLARHIIDVMSYGAKGDGSTDDSAVFSAAEADGRLVFIPKTADGYKLTSPVSTADGAWLPDPTLTWAQATDSGKLDMRRGRWTGLGNGANIWRFADRVFVGEAASHFAGDTPTVDSGDSWLGDPETAPHYLGVNAQLLVTTEANGNGMPYAIVAGVRTSNAGNHSIGVGSAVVADAAGRFAWGFIAELQRESGALSVYGMEVAAKNKGDNATMTPNVTPAGVYGVWLAGGGDDAFGGAPVNPSTAAVAIVGGAHTWNTGIVFRKDALTNGEAISLSSQGNTGAHFLRWYDASNRNVFQVFSNASDGVSWRLLRDSNGLSVIREGVYLVTIGSTPTPANGLTLFAHSTGNAPIIAAQGSDTDIDIRLAPKGAGLVRFGTHSPIGAETVTGYITIKDANGTVRKLAVVS